MSRADAKLINSVVATRAHIDLHENRVGVCFVVHDLTIQKSVVRCKLRNKRRFMKKIMGSFVFERVK